MRDDPPVVTHITSERRLFQISKPAVIKDAVSTTITMTLSFNVGLLGNVHVSIAAGTRSLETTVHRHPQSVSGGWVVAAIIPQLEEPLSRPLAVPIAVFISADRKVLDFAKCGYFAYVSTSPSIQRPQLRVETQKGGVSSASRVRPAMNLVAPPAVDDGAAGGAQSGYGTSSHSSLAVLHPRPSVSGHLVRAPRSDKPHFGRGPLSVEFVAPLEDMCHGWDAKELRANRRLVKFVILREGTYIIMDFVPLPQDKYDSNDVVISCIRNEEFDTFHVTSVDILHLFQSMCEHKLSVREKTRLRRNIQCFLPVRLAKTDCQFANFFRVIMGLPVPKPRTIEKKLKVFSWTSLRAILQKMLSKYCLSETDSEHQVVLQNVTSGSEASPCPSEKSIHNRLPDSNPTLSPFSPCACEESIHNRTQDPNPTSVPLFESVSSVTLSSSAFPFTPTDVSAVGEYNPKDTHPMEVYQHRVSQSTTMHVESVYMNNDYGSWPPYLT